MMMEDKVMGRASVITQIIIERDFGKCDFLSLYAGYVSDMILESMKQDKDNKNEDSEKNFEKTADLH